MFGWTVNLLAVSGCLLELVLGVWFFSCGSAMDWLTVEEIFSVKDFTDHRSVTMNIKDCYDANILLIYCLYLKKLFNITKTHAVLRWYLT